MTDTPIRTHATTVARLSGRWVAHVPDDWAPDTPVLVVAGLPEGATIRPLCDVPEGWEWQNDAGNWHPARRFGAEDECTGYVLCRPKPEPDLPATDADDLSGLPDADLLDRVDEWCDAVLDRDNICDGLDARAMLYELVSRWQVLVGPAPTGDDEPTDTTVIRGLTRRFDGEPQADTPAPQGRWTVDGNDLVWDGKHRLWRDGVAALEHDDFPDWFQGKSWDALVDLVRRDGTDPTPDLTPLFDALDAHDRVQARFGTGAGASFKVLAAVRAIRDGGTR